MSLMSVMTHAGLTLTYDSDDVEECTVSAPHDMHERASGPGAGVVRELGQAHLLLHVKFKEGKRPLWRNEHGEVA